MNPAATALSRLTELTAALAAAAAAVLIAMPVEAQTLPARELDLARAERFGLTLPFHRGQASAADVERAKANRDAEFQRARAAGELPAFQAERYGLMLPPLSGRPAAASAVDDGLALGTPAQHSGS
jgi:hypothetical protein